MALPSLRAGSPSKTMPRSAEASTEPTETFASPENVSSPGSRSTGPESTSQKPSRSTSGAFSPDNSPSRLSPLPSPNEGGSRHSSNRSPTPASFQKAYIDQSRGLLEKQRRLFEQERSLFEQERRLWDVERQGLYARVAELEGDEQVRLGLRGVTSKVGSMGAWRPYGGGSAGTNSRSASRQSSAGVGDGEERFWEGSSSRQGSVASRTFSNTVAENGRLPSIAEGQGKDADTRQAGRDEVGQAAGGIIEVHDPVIGKGIDISVIRDDLDGIPIKPSALPATIVCKVQTPPSGQSPGAGGGSNDGALRVVPSDENLTRDAGHTPNAPRRMSMADESGSATPTQTVHVHNPSMTGERGDVRLQDADPELKGPLALPSDGAPDDSPFLHELDSKLLQEARKIVYGPSASSSETASSIVSVDGDEDDKGEAADAGGDGDRDLPPVRQPEPEIRLKFKRSMNFGSAFGVGSMGTT